VIGPEAIKSVKTVSYELTDPTVDSQLVSLKAAGVDTLIAGASIKFGALVIRKVSDLGWRPLYFQSNVSTSVAGVMIPAGSERGVGIVSSAYLKDPTDPAWTNNPDMVTWRTFMGKYYPEAH
jgi:branched-chain amino acid transport system substrate-binding protein